LARIWQPGDVREVRIPKWDKYGHTAAGWFDDPVKLAAAAARYDGKANIYVTANPVEPALLGRADNRIAERMDATSNDTNIVYRRLLFVDIDPVRPAGISSKPSPWTSPNAGQRTANTSKRCSRR